MRTPVDFNLALVQPIAPFAQRIGRQTQSCSVFANAHSAPVHRLDMHRPERLRAAIAHVCAYAEAPSLTSLQSFLPLLTALLAAQFRLIFHKLACSFLASKMLEPARECLLVKSMLTAIFCLRNAAALPRLDVNRPPLASGLVLEMFWTHRRFSTAAENPKWNEDTLSKSRARTDRLQARQGKARRDKANWRSLAPFGRKGLSAHWFL